MSFLTEKTIKIVFVVNILISKMLKRGRDFYEQYKEKRRKIEDALDPIRIVSDFLEFQPSQQQSQKEPMLISQQTTKNPHSKNFSRMVRYGRSSTGRYRRRSRYPARRSYRKRRYYRKNRLQSRYGGGSSFNRTDESASRVTFGRMKQPFYDKAVVTLEAPLVLQLTITAGLTDGSLTYNMNNLLDVSQSIGSQVCAYIKTYGNFYRTGRVLRAAVDLEWTADTAGPIAVCYYPYASTSTLVASTFESAMVSKYAQSGIKVIGASSGYEKSIRAVYDMSAIAGDEDVSNLWTQLPTTFGVAGAQPNTLINLVTFFKRLGPTTGAVVITMIGLMRLSVLMSEPRPIVTIADT